MKIAFYLLASLIAFSGLSACSSDDDEVLTSASLPATPTQEPGGGGGPVTPGNPGPNPDPGGPVVSTAPVCDPFGVDGVGQSDANGWVADLWYAPSGYNEFISVYDYFNWGARIKAPIYISRLNIPTVAFKNGFARTDGTFVQTPKNETVVDYFALRIRSTVKLAPWQKTGRYQFAILSDDGAVVRINSDGTLRVLVNNDGGHATRLACAERIVRMNRDSAFPIEVDYFQGARDHIALTLLWRRLAETNHHLDDIACGREGDDEFSMLGRPRASPKKPGSTCSEGVGRSWGPRTSRCPRMPVKILVLSPEAALKS